MQRHRFVCRCLNESLLGDGDRRSRSSLRPFEAGSRGTLGRRFQAEKGGAQGGRYRPV